MKNTVMHLISTSFFGGPEKQITEHLKLLKQRETYDGILGSFIEGGQENETLIRAQESGLHHCEIRMSNPLDFIALWNLRQILISKDVDLLCLHGYKSVVMGHLAARSVNIPTLAFSRGYTSENGKVRFYEWLERKFLEKCDGIICVSEGQKTKLTSLNVKGREKWVVRNAVNISPESPIETYSCSDLKKSLNVPSEALMIVTAGRLSPEKGHYYLVKAIALLKDRLPNAYFIFCGDGPTKESLLNETRKMGIDKRCRFIGFRKDLDTIMHCMDIFVLPSLTEGLPNVILESFSHAKPVVATNVGGVPELVVHQRNGLLVAPERADLLSDSILELADAPEKRIDMGQKGFSTVKRHFSFSEQNLQLESIYQNILSKKHAARRKLSFRRN